MELLVRDRTSEGLKRRTAYPRLQGAGSDLTNEAPHDWIHLLKMSDCGRELDHQLTGQEATLDPI